MFNYTRLQKILMLGVAVITCAANMTNAQETIQSNSAQIDTHLTKAKDTPKEAKRHWQEAALLHSGIANIKLAELALTEKPINRDQAIYYYTQAAQFGYPECYQTVAELVKAKQGKEGKCELLDDCYRNVAQVSPDNALLNYCQSALVGSFHYGRNQGIQSESEAQQKATDDIRQFCSDPGKARWLHPDINILERQALFKIICADEVKQQSALEVGDIVFKDNQLFTFTDKGFIDYLNPIENGLVAYRLNDPVSVFVYQEGELKPVENGDTVIKDGHAFVVKNNRLVQR